MDLLEFSRDHAEEIDVLADGRALFLLTLIAELGNTTRQALSSHLGWDDEVIEALWQKLKSADLVRDETAFGRENPIRLSTVGSTIVASLGFPGRKSLLDRLLQSSPRDLIAVIGDFGIAKRREESPLPKQHETRELIIRARAGDREAFETMFRSLGPSLYRQSFSILHNAADAEDVVQQAFMKILGGRFELEDRPIEPLLRKIIRNTSVDILRQRLRRHETSLEEAVEEAGAEEGLGLPGWLDESWAELRQSHLPTLPQSPARQEEAAIVAEALRIALADLRPSEVRVLTLWLEGMNVQEIAYLLRMSPGSVANTRGRVRARLRDVLARELGKRRP